MRILGIETSCDETGAAVIEANPEDKKVKLLSNVVASSLNLHSKTGGIIPQIAAREQVKYITPVIKKALGPPRRWRGNDLDSFEVDNNETIDAIAVTVGPGLIGSLLVGVETAKTLAYVWNKPIIPVNHLIGHIYANFVGKISNLKTQNLKLDARRYSLDADIEFPALALIVSGGHTDLVFMKKHGSIKLLGGTRDDAAGEAFDKIGRLLGLPYPGGPSIEKAAKNGNPKAFNFPRPMIDSNDFDFSFSGLKTSVANLVRKRISEHSENSVYQNGQNVRKSDALKHRRADYSGSLSFSESFRTDIAASVQQAVIDVLVAKTIKAAQKYKARSILLSGGVAANQKLRDQLKLDARRYSLDAKIFVPEKFLCMDNAAMIATAVFFNYKPIPWQKLTADPELYFD